MTAINQQTRGPVTVNQEILLYAPDGRGMVAKAHDHNKTPTEYVANARLLAAAYTAFDGAGRKLGVDAAEMAERLGPEGLAEVIEAFTDMMSAFDVDQRAGEGSAIAKGRAALTLLTGK